jgi:F-type H+-transporting ATPase subunit delta
MSNQRVAYAYAKSLMDLAIERGELEKVYQDFLYLGQMTRSNRDLEVVMRSPVISSDKKLSILKALYEKQGATEATISFFEIISRKGRETVLPDIAREFETLYQIHNSIQTAEVTTTIPLDEALRAKFIEIVKEISGRREVKLTEKINPELIGGFILRVNDRQLDESLSSKLRDLRVQFSENHYESKI